MALPRWVDTHIHVSRFGKDGSTRERLATDLVAVLDGSGGDLRLVCSCDLPEVGRMREDATWVLEANRTVYELTQAAPGRLFGACMVNPHFLRESMEAVETCFGQWGFVLFGEMLQYIMQYDPAGTESAALVRRCAELGVPVQLHVSTNTEKGVEHFEGLVRMARAVPEAKVILAHALGGAMSGYYIDQVQSCGIALERLWLEVRDFNHVEALRRALGELGADRLIAGTDWTTRVGPPFQPYGTIFNVAEADNPFPPSVASLVGFLREAGATDDEVEQVAWRNADALLGLGLAEA